MKESIWQIEWTEKYEIQKYSGEPMQSLFGTGAMLYSLRAACVSWHDYWNASHMTVIKVVDGGLRILGARASASPQTNLSICLYYLATYDDVIKRKHFPCYWPFVRGIHRSPVNPPLKGQWRGALMFSLICAWTNGWVNNREAGDLRSYRAHHDVAVNTLIKGQLSVFSSSSGQPF